MLDAQTNQLLGIFHALDFFSSALTEKVQAILLQWVFSTIFMAHVVQVLF